MVIPNEIPTQRDGPVFGYEQFWTEAYARFKPQFDAIGELIHLANEVIHAADACDSEPVKNVILGLTGTTLTGAVEVVLLCGNGCGLGAMKIARGMYESRWTARYLCRHPQEVEDYLEFSKVLLLRKLHWQQENGMGAGIPQDVIKRVEDDFNRVKARFMDGKGKVRFSWSKWSIRAMAKAIGREKEYDLPYAIASSIHHGNFEGLSAHHRSDDGAVVPDIPPSETWITKALLAAHVNLWFALCTLDESCGLDFGQRLDAAQKVFSSVWKS